MRKTEEKAYAKINIGLDVLGRREDGYHELKMVMQTIDLCDDVLLSWEEGGTDREIRILCDTPGVPCDRRNLAYRAAEAFFSRCSEKEGLLFPGRLEIRLVKRIPALFGNFYKLKAAYRVNFYTAQNKKTCCRRRIAV